MKPGVLLQLEPRTPDQGLGELRRHKLALVISLGFSFL
jgi:hypothetical protein